MSKGVWTHFLFFDQFFPICFKFKYIHVKIVHQPEGKAEKMTCGPRMYLYSVICVVCYLWSLSPAAAKSPWICGLDFQSSLFGGGSTLTLEDSAVLQELAVLFTTKQDLLQQHSMKFQCGYIFPQWACLHIFHQVFRALNQNDSFKW